MKLIKSIWQSHIFGYGIKQRFTVAGITISLILISFFIGRLLDMWTKQKAVFSLTLVVLSFPITQWLVYKVLKKQGEKKL